MKIGIKLVGERKNINIKPVFLLGTQGGGLTLVARILRKHPRSFCVFGNSSHWAGAGEMQNVLRHVLPEELTWKDIKGTQNGAKEWFYATNEYLPFYRNNGNVMDVDLKNKFISLIQKIAKLNTPQKINPCFFIDNSQLYTVKVGLINKLLKKYNPKFILITRNPYFMCWRAVNVEGAIKNLKISEKEKLGLAIQHWKNSFESALEDGGNNLKVFRFEDILLSPEKEINKICDFIGMDFNPNILPRKDDKMPLGSIHDVHTKKWYPLNSGINKEYLDSIPDWAVNMINRGCMDLIGIFGYTSKGP